MPKHFGLASCGNEDRLGDDQDLVLADHLAARPRPRLRSLSGNGARDPDGGPRLDAILGSIMAQPIGPLPDMVCSAAVLRLDVPGVSLMVAASDELLQSAYATELGRIGDGLQEELGEGPGYAAHIDARPVLVADLAQDGRWPAFALAAVESGIRAGFSFPIGSGAVRLGTLNLYSPAAGPLADEQHADALVFARLAFDLFTTPPEFGGNDPTDRHAWPGAGSHGPQLHQAIGMVSAQLSVKIGDALAVLRAHAFANDRSLSDVATDVIARQLRFNSEL